MNSILHKLKKCNTSFDWLVMVPPEIIIQGYKTRKVRYSETEILACENGSSVISMEDFAYALVNEITHNKHNGTLIHTAY